MKELLSGYIANKFLVEVIIRVGTFALEMLIAYVLWRLCRGAINRYRRKNAEKPQTETIASMIGSAVKYVIYFFAFVAALQTLFGVNVMSIMAAAGVVGIAVAFGAQSIVKDLITGFFMIFEGALKVGDIVTIDGFTGAVDSVTLRCTTLKNYKGDLYIIPNGSIVTVLNHQKAHNAVALDVMIAYESDIDKAISVLYECGKAAAADIPDITGDPDVLGVIALEDSGVKIRMLVPSLTGNSQFVVEREMLRRIKYAFNKNGIEIPYNRMVVINKGDSK